MLVLRVVVEVLTGGFSAVLVNNILVIMKVRN